MGWQEDCIKWMKEGRGKGTGREGGMKGKRRDRREGEGRPTRGGKGGRGREGGEEREGKREEELSRFLTVPSFSLLALGSSDLSLDLQDSLFPLRVPWCLSS